LRENKLLGIGEILDKMTLDSKALNYQYYDAATDFDKKPKRPTQDFTSADFKFNSHFAQIIDPKTPYFFEDESKLQDLPEPHFDRVEMVN